MYYFKTQFSVQKRYLHVTRQDSNKYHSSDDVLKLLKLWISDHILESTCVITFTFTRSGQMVGVYVRLCGVWLCGDWSNSLTLPVTGYCTLSWKIRVLVTFGQACLMTLVSTVDVTSPFSSIKCSHVNIMNGLLLWGTWVCVLLKNNEGVIVSHHMLLTGSNVTKENSLVDIWLFVHCPFCIPTSIVYIHDHN